MKSGIAEILRSEDGQYYVCYKAKNGKVVAVSETLKTKNNALKNIAAMQVICGGKIKIVEHAVN